MDSSSNSDSEESYGANEETDDSYSSTRDDSDQTVTTSSDSDLENDSEDKAYEDSVRNVVSDLVESAKRDCEQLNQWSENSEKSKETVKKLKESLSEHSRQTIDFILSQSKHIVDDGRYINSTVCRESCIVAAMTSFASEWEMDAIVDFEEEIELMNPSDYILCASFSRLPFVLQERIGKACSSLHNVNRWLDLESFCLIMADSRAVVRTIDEYSHSVCFFIGLTGSGKTALIAYLAGRKFEYNGSDLNPRRNESVEDARKFADFTPKASLQSATFQPAVIKAQFGENSLLLCDLPGLLDTRGIEVAVACGVVIADCMNAARKGKICVVFNAKHISTMDDGVSVRSLVNELMKLDDRLQADDEWESAIQGYIFFVTRADNQDKTSIKNRLKRLCRIDASPALTDERTKRLIQHIAHNFRIGKIMDGNETCSDEERKSLLRKIYRTKRCNKNDFKPMIASNQQQIVAEVLGQSWKRIKSCHDTGRCFSYYFGMYSFCEFPLDLPVIRQAKETIVRGLKSAMECILGFLEEGKKIPNNARTSRSICTVMCAHLFPHVVNDTVATFAENLYKIVVAYVKDSFARCVRKLEKSPTEKLLKLLESIRFVMYCVIFASSFTGKYIFVSGLWKEIMSPIQDLCNSMSYKESYDTVHTAAALSVTLTELYSIAKEQLVFKGNRKVLEYVNNQLKGLFVESLEEDRRVIWSFDEEQTIWFVLQCGQFMSLHFDDEVHDTGEVLRASLLMSSRYTSERNGMKFSFWNMALQNQQCIIIVGSVSDESRIELSISLDQLLTQGYECILKTFEELYKKSKSNDILLNSLLSLLEMQCFTCIDIGDFSDKLHDKHECVKKRAARLFIFQKI